tara:strand:+ start:509 stop:664 length:156 start_codon:yes stop_codon:yes gene_type:complete
MQKQLSSVLFYGRLNGGEHHLRSIVEVPSSVGFQLVEEEHLLVYACPVLHP